MFNSSTMNEAGQYNGRKTTSTINSVGNTGWLYAKKKLN